MKKLYMIFIFVFLFLVGCNENKINIEIDDINCDISEFDITNYYIKVIDNNVKYVKITNDMVTIDDLDKLNEIGEHQLEINYKGIKKVINVTLTKKVISFDVDTSNINTDVDEFKLSDIILTVNYSDNSKEIKNCDSSMLSINDNNKLTRPGTHEFYINYESLYKKVSITLEKYINIKFVVEGDTIYEEKVKVGENPKMIPNIPIKENYDSCWSINDFSKLSTDTTIEAIYTFKNSNLFEEVKQELINRYSNMTISSNIELLNTYNGCTISYSSSYISSRGILTRPYQKTNTDLLFTIKYNEVEEQITIPVTIEGYKSLDNGIASNYIYRYYNKLTDEYFETMDIIYCAFIEIDVNGEFDGLDATGSSIKSSNQRVKQNIQNYIMPKAKEKGIYVIASLGGGGSAPKQTFQTIASSETLRKAFASNIVKLINEYGFDGIDLDWETPTTSEKENFTLLVKEIYEQVKKNNPNHLITSAIGGGKWQPPRYDLTNSIKYLDYVNIMTYSMCSNTGYYQNALYASKNYHNQELKVGKTLSSCSIDESKTIFLNLNVPLSKMIFGLSFYGVRQTYKDNEWGSGKSIMYDTIKSYINSGSYTYYYDEVAQVPYLIDSTNTYFISYDDPTSIKAKCKYVKDNKIGGIMYWENGCDQTGELVHAINQGLKNVS